jgi:hypothetical protein
MQSNELEWKDALHYFHVLRTHRLHYRDIEDVGSACRVVSELARDLAFEKLVAASSPEMNLDLGPLCEQLEKATVRLRRADRQFSLVLDRVAIAPQGARTLFTAKEMRTFLERLNHRGVMDLALAYRQLADRLASDAKWISNNFRRQRGASTGKLPHGEVVPLLTWAAQHKVGIRALARQLANEGIRPDESIEEETKAELATRWEVLLKAHRRRQRAKSSG